MKLKAKFSISVTILIFFLIIGISVFLFIGEKQLILREKRDKAETTIKSLAHAGKEYLITKNRIQLMNFVKQLKGDATLKYSGVFDSNARILAHTDVTLIGKTDPAGSELEQLKMGEISQKELMDNSGNVILEYSYLIEAGDESSAVAKMGFIKEELEKEINKSLAKTMKMIFVVSLVALLIGVLGAVLMAQMMTSPINKMASGAALIGKGKLDTVIDVKTNDELGGLAADLNKMAVKLRELDEMKQDFVSNVTHELRSPLNSLGMYFDIFFKGQLGEVTEEQKECLFTHCTVSPTCTCA